MPFLLLIWNNKRWTIIAILLFLILLMAFQLNSLAGDLIKAKDECQNKVATAIQPYKDAEHKAQEKAQQAGEDYENTRSTERTKTETITREVQKIIERPIYINDCFDTDGVSAVNAAGNTG